MAFNGTYNSLSCSYMNNLEQTIKKPLHLNSDRDIFIENENDSSKIKCDDELCDYESLIKNKIDSEKMFIPSVIQNGLDGIVKQTSEQINKFKCLLNDIDETIEINFEYVRDEIEIKIESMKIELDEIRGSFNKKLEEIKEKLIKKQKQKLYLESEKFDIKLKDLKNEIKNESIKNEIKMYDCEKTLSDLNQDLKNSIKNFFNYEIKFYSSNKKIDENLIGDVVLRFNKIDLSYDQVKEAILFKKFETIKRGLRPYDFCTLSNKIVCISSRSIEIYDENFKLLKKYEEIGTYHIQPTGLTINNNNEIFVSDVSNHCIYKFDLELNKLKTVGSYGSKNSQFSSPFFICCNNENLYVNDQYNKKIKIFTFDLVYVDCIELDFICLSIAVSNNCIGVSGSNGTFFFDLRTKSIKNSYKKIGGRINKINNIFYILSSKCNLTCFNTDGDLIQEFFIKKLNGYIENIGWDGCICHDDLYIYMSSVTKNEIIRFSIN